MKLFFLVGTLTFSLFSFADEIKIIESKLPEFNHCLKGHAETLVLKHDYFPGIRKKKAFRNELEIDLKDEAPNLRQIENDDVYGLGQPRARGVEKIVTAINKSSGKNVTWLNLREEPIIYLNDEPYSVRDINKPFNNLENVSNSQIESFQIEECVKKEIIKFASKNNFEVPVHEELPDNKSTMTKIKFKKAETMNDLFVTLNKSNKKLKYIRFPLTDEKAQSYEQLISLSKILKVQSDNANLVLNCQMGRGRTTSAIALLYLTKGEKIEGATFKASELLDLDKIRFTEKNEKKRDEAILRFKRLDVMSDILNKIN
jgi:hypothetical protein